jgi:hypothetical protein
MQKTAAEILSVSDPERWSTLVFGSPVPDVYYLPGYAQAASEIEHTEPMAIVVGQDSCRFLIPLLLRSNTAIVNDSRIDWIDTSSPYGYGGILPLSCNTPDAHSIHCLLEDLRRWCSGRDAVCCVLRLHPLMDQAQWFLPEEQWQKQLRVYLRGSTAAINLEHWDEARDCPDGMRKGRRSDLNLAHRDLHVTWTNGEAFDLRPSLDRFLTLYEQSMENHSADNFYKFPPAYFSQLASLGHRFRIAFAWLGDQLAGASIFLAGSDYAHYHLAAGNELGRKHKAATLLIVEGARWARQHGHKLLHLGGGVHPGDSLEDFKRSFGSQLYRYAYLVVIIDEKRFEQLSQLSNAPWPYSLNPT